MSNRTIRHFAEYLAMRIALALVQAVSIETCEAVCNWLAWLAADVLKVRARVVDENLRMAFPEMGEHGRHDVARRMWRHLLLMMCEAAQLKRKFHETNWRKYVEAPRKREWIRAAGRPGPKVCVTGHFGNFEALGHVNNFWGFKTYAVARTMDNPYIDRFVLDHRAAIGQSILPKEDSAGIADTILQTGGILGILGDQHAGRKGCIVDFLGRPASCHKAVALFALLHRAPVMVVTGTRADRPMRFTMQMDSFITPQDNPEEFSSVENLTQWYNDVLARRIREQPEQYWWLHDRWKEIKARQRRKAEPKVDADMQRDAA